MPKSTIEVEKLLSLPSASCPSVSHDGHRVASFWNVTGRTELYVADLPNGDPEENEELWRDRSAIHFAQNLKAKLLMIHGVNDARCPVGQARAFRDRLPELRYQEGADFEYVELGKVGHASSDIRERLKTYGTIARYLEENV